LLTIILEPNFNNINNFTVWRVYIATKLRAMDKVTQQYAMNDINNIMFNAALNTYYSTAQQHPKNQQTSSFQQIPPLHSTYQSNKPTPAVLPYSHIPYSFQPLQDQISPAPSNSMYKPDQITTSATHLMHPSYQNTQPISSHSAHSSTSENPTLVYPNSSFSSYKQISVPSNSANHTIEHLSLVNPHSSYPPNENISNPSNSITLTTLETLPHNLPPCSEDQ